MEDWLGPLTVTAVYSPPKHNIKKEQYEQFFKTLGNRFIAGGDYNTKHPWWGSRSHIPTPKGRQLYNTIQNKNLKTLSTGEPTYWPSDSRKNPDVIDFCVTKGIPMNNMTICSTTTIRSFTSSGNTSIGMQIIKNKNPPMLANKRTNWQIQKNIKRTNYL